MVGGAGTRRFVDLPASDDGMRGVCVCMRERKREKGWRWDKGTLEVGGFNLFTDLFLNPQTASTSYKPPMNIHKPITKPINDGEYLAWSSR